MSLIVWSLAAALWSHIAGAQNPAEQRGRMVKTQIEGRGVRNAAVLKAMRDTPRHEFVPDELHARAYDDSPLPIGYSQTISQPYIVASMTEMIAPERHHKILEIGTGSGYQAAILAQLAGHVYTIEIVEPLGQEAEQRLKRMGYRNVSVRIGDGYQGWPEEAPFDRIIITAAPPELPQSLVQQLKNGGRLVAPVGREWQELVIVEKDLQGRVTQRSSYPVMFVPMVKGRR